MTPEAKARQQIADKLAAAGCEVQAEISRALVEYRVLAVVQSGALGHAFRETVAQRKNVHQGALSGQLLQQGPRDTVREMT